MDKKENHEVGGKKVKKPGVERNPAQTNQQERATASMSDAIFNGFLWKLELPDEVATTTPGL